MVEELHQLQGFLWPLLGDQSLSPLQGCPNQFFTQKHKHLNKYILRYLWSKVIRKCCLLWYGAYFSVCVFCGSWSPVSDFMGNSTVSVGSPTCSRNYIKVKVVTKVKLDNGWLLCAMTHCGSRKYIGSRVNSSWLSRGFFFSCIKAFELVGHGAWSENTHCIKYLEMHFLRPHLVKHLFIYLLKLKCSKSLDQHLQGRIVNKMLTSVAKKTPGSIITALSG